MSPDPQPDRYAYRDHLLAIMADCRRTVCLDTDTGLFAGVDFGPHGDRYLNLGIAEQNVMGVAAGLAAAGWLPFVNTMATFAATRAVEAVKIDIAYNALPVRIVGTHAGLAAGHLGPTHQALEDLAVMRTLPNMTVVIPGDARSVPPLLDQVRALPGPAYVRLGRKAVPPLPVDATAAVLGRIQPLREGGDVVIVCTGPLPVHRSLTAAGVLAAEGIEAAVLHAHTVKPFDAATLLAYATPVPVVVTVEEHWRTGGLGSAVAEALAEAAPRRVVRLGVPDAFVASVGTQEELMDGAGMSVAELAATVRRELTR